MKALHKVGDIEVVKYRWYWRECRECEKPAIFRVSYLFENARSNPASAGYRKDDISWCSDEDDYACRSCVKKLERNPPNGMDWCATFTLSKFQHMGWYKVKA